MAYTRPDLSNLRMQSVEEFRSSPAPSTASQTPPASSSAGKTATPLPENSTKPFKASIDLLRSSFSSSPKTTRPHAVKTSFPPPERNNKPYEASPSTPPYSPSSASHVARTSSPASERSNNPYVSNNPWLSSSNFHTGDSAPSSRPDLTRYKSYSLDLPRPSPSPTTKQAEAQSESVRNSVSLERAEEGDSVAANFGLGQFHDVKEFIEYAIWNASLTNMRVCPIELDGQFFYVAHRSFLPNRPGVVIHSGSTKDGAVLGVAHLDFFSTSNQLGVGDPDGAPMAVVWEKMHKESFWTHMRYSFTWDVEETMKGLTETEKHVFEWHRTKNNFLWDDQGDLVLVEKGKDEVLALYEGKGPLGQLPGKIRGTLKIKPKADGFKDGWEMMVVLSWASIVELSRRRTRSRRISTVFGHI